MDAPPEFAPGATFAKDFRVVRKLAEGGMGVVYLVEQLSTRKQRALKVMHASMVRDGRSRERFLQEARVSSEIESDHIVDVVAAGIDEGTGMPWLAMEFLRGQTLAEYVEQRGSLEPGEAREMFRQLRHALGQAHALGLVHRDLKPENIFMATPRRSDVPFTAKVLDFGITKMVQAARTAAANSQVIGSPFWMAPEQLEAGARISPATDVWALGLIAFHVLTGRIYWLAGSNESASVGAVIIEMLIQPIAPPTERARELGAPDGMLPAGFDPWFLKCVTRRTDDRFSSSDDCLAAFDAIWSAAAHASEPSPAQRSNVPVVSTKTDQVSHHTAPSAASPGYDGSTQQGTAPASRPGSSTQPSPAPSPALPPVPSSRPGPGANPVLPVHPASMVQPAPPAPPAQRPSQPAPGIPSLLNASLGPVSSARNEPSLKQYSSPDLRPEHPALAQYSSPDLRPLHPALAAMGPAQPAPAARPSMPAQSAPVAPPPSPPPQPTPAPVPAHRQGSRVGVPPPEPPASAPVITSPSQPAPPIAPARGPSAPSEPPGPSSSAPPSLPDALGQTKFSTGELSATAQRWIEALAVNPTDVAALSGLFQRAVADGRIDRALSAAHTLKVVLGEAAPPDTVALLAQHANTPRPAPQGRVDDKAWMRDMTPTEGAAFAPITAFFQLILPSLQRVLAVAPTKAGLLDRERVDPLVSSGVVLRSTLPLQKAMLVAGAAFDVASMPVLYFRATQSEPLRCVPTEPWSTLVGGYFQNEKPTAAKLNFLAGRHIAYYRPEHYIRVLFPAPEALAALVDGARAIARSPDGAGGPPGATMDTLRKVFGSDTAKRAQLARAVEACDTQAIPAWFRLVDRVSARAGLLLCGDLELARSSLSLSPGVHSVADTDELFRDLVMFSVSDGYFRLREVLGMAVKG